MSQLIYCANFKMLLILLSLENHSSRHE